VVSTFTSATFRAHTAARCLLLRQTTPMLAKNDAGSPFRPPTFIFSSSRSHRMRFSSCKGGDAWETIVAAQREARSPAVRCDVEQHGARALRPASLCAATALQDARTLVIDHSQPAWPWTHLHIVLLEGIRGVPPKRAGEVLC